MNVSNPEFSRNLGFYSEDEQQRLNHATVAIAGAGGDGGALAVQLARMGVGEIRLADPDPFEAENINRQEGCTTKTIGMNKALAVGELIHDINPEIKVVTETYGIHQDNVEEFLDGASLVIDETEFTMHQLGVMIARQARKQQIPNLMAMNVGFGTIVTSFSPNGRSFERHMGLDERMPLDEIADQKVSLSRWLPYVPPYADIKVFEKVAKGEKSAPSVAPGVAIAAGTGAVQAFLHLVGDLGNNRPSPVIAPKARVIDVMNGESRDINFPRVSHYKYLGKMLLANALGKAPKASY